MSTPERRPIRPSRPACVALALGVLGGLARAQSTERVSVSTGGDEATSYSTSPAISDDGRWVVFDSPATNLVLHDANSAWDVFVRDLRTGRTALASVATGGAQANGPSQQATISRDGRVVVFASLATNLVAGDTNGFSDVYARDLQTGTTERVNVSSGGAEANGDTPFAVLVSTSSDGRFVAFGSRATNLVPGDTNNQPDVFVRDRIAGITVRVSVATGGGEGDAPSDQPSISADGRFVAFRTRATNLVVGDTNGFEDILVHDRFAQTTVLASVATSGAQGNGPAAFPSISADGRYVALWSSASNLVAGDTNGLLDNFVRDLQLQTTERISVATNGAEGTDHAHGPCSFSRDGRFVAFASVAPNLIAGDTNGTYDVYVRDRRFATTERVSISSAGNQGNGHSSYPAISGDGRIVVFSSYASNLVGGDTNMVLDIFERDRGTPGTSYCSGDGTGAACPCGPGAPGSGCPSSVNAAGATLAANGTASLATDTLVLSGSGMPQNWALYLQGTAQAAGGAGIPFGDGLRCVGGTFMRLGTKSNVGGASEYPAPGDVPISIRGQVTMPGVRHYQVWYRNAAPFCTSSTFNLTNGLSVTWTLS